MALLKPSSGQPPAENYRRFGLAFDAIDAASSDIVDMMAVDADLATRIAIETQQRTNEVASIVQGLSDEAERAGEVEADLARRIAIETQERKNETAIQDDKISGVEQSLGRGLADEAERRRAAFAIRDLRSLDALAAAVEPGRPGVSPVAFSTALVGSIGDTAPLDPSGRITTPLGTAYRIAGSGLIAPRATIAVDPDAIWILKARYWRLTDTANPNNGAIDIGIQWLGPDGAGIGTSLVRRDRDLFVQSGPRSLTVRVPSIEDDDLGISAPKGAVAWRPYLRAYGGDGAVAVQVLGATDATFAGVYAPDVSALATRLGTIEAQISTGLPFATPILPAFAVEDLPAPGTPGRKAFARNGRAPNAAGTLEAANAGTGVEVVDNGSKWVISGTNQAVQA